MQPFQDDLDQLVVRSVVQALAATPQFLVQVDRGFNHSFMGLIGTTQQQKVVAGS